ncbi:MAG: ribonuclease III [Ruminococcaceae bacterium]|nr:ribonuclease III [Oscillospiraceae bacterium]
MDKLFSSDVNPKELSSLTLAFVGDSVYDLLVREYLLTKGTRRVGDLNKYKVSMVCCNAQTKALERIIELLTEEEEAVFKRGRNVQVNSVPKNSTLKDYHTATGLEALFGYLYLSGRVERIKELFSFIIADNE